MEKINFNDLNKNILFEPTPVFRSWKERSKGEKITTFILIGLIIILIGLMWGLMKGGN
jgi:hypothetical protein